MTARVLIQGKRAFLKLVGVYFVAGGWSGLAFYYITRITALESVVFQRSEKFLIPTYWYWALLGTSLLLAIAAGWIITNLAGWQNRRQICWFRYPVAALLIATSVPFQVWLLNTKQQVNEDFSAYTTDDLYVVAVFGGIAIIVYSVGQLTRARWRLRLPISILLIALLAVWPTGVFALFLTLAAYAMTGRVEIRFALLMVLAVIVGFVASGVIGQLVGIISIWPLAVSSVSAIWGYQMYRTGPRNPEAVPNGVDSTLVGGGWGGPETN